MAETVFVKHVLPVHKYQRQNKQPQQHMVPQDKYPKDNPKEKACLHICHAIPVNVQAAIMSQT